MLIHQSFKDTRTARLASDMLRRRFGLAQHPVSIGTDGKTVVIDISAMNLIPTSTLTIQMQCWLEGVDVGTTRF